MHENMLYLTWWQQNNPKLSDLLITNNNLIYKDQSVDIANFYFPEMLYNETFRKKLNQDYNSENLFQIIKVYCNAQKIIENNNQIIIDMTTKKDESQNEFLIITTNDQKKYRFDTQNQEEIKNYFLSQKNAGKNITINQLKEMILNANSK